MQFLLSAYVFFVAWYGVFLSSDWVRIPTILSFFAAAAVAYNILKKDMLISRKTVSLEDILIIALLFALVANAGFSTAPLKAGNYLLAYFFVFSIQYFFVKLALVNFTIVNACLRANVYGVLIVAGLMVIEFIFNYFLTFSLQEFVPRTRPAVATTAGFTRSYGVGSEPRVMSYYLVTLGPLAIWSVFRQLDLALGYRLTFLGVIFLAFFSSASAGGFVAASASASVVCMYKIYALVGRPFVSKRFLSWLCAGLLSLVVLVVYSPTGSVIIGVAENLARKISISKAGSAIDKRYYDIMKAVSAIMEDPLTGKGLGFFSMGDRGGVQSWYFLLSAEAGLLPLIFISIFFSIVTVRVLRSRSDARLYVLFGLVGGAVSLMAQPGFFYPFIWLLVAFFYALDVKSYNVGRCAVS